MDRKATGVRNIRSVTMEIRNEDPASFTNFLRMPTDMSDELLDRVGPRITKVHIRYREPEAFTDLTPSLHLGTSMPQWSSA